MHLADPFEAEPTSLGRFANRLGFTEGQLWSLSIGAVLTLLLLASGLPDVVWRAPALTQLAQAPAPAPVGQQQPQGAAILPPVAPFEPTSSPSFEEEPTLTAPETPTPAAPTSPSAPAAVSTIVIVSGGYASATAGNPLATAGVPEGSLAVALRGGDPEKVAFVRLAGEGDFLDLTVDETPGANVLDALAGLLLCPVLDDGWSVGAGDTSLADAPRYDCGDPVVGVRSESGLRWTFDLTDLADPTSSRGLAIVPDAAAASPVFQVALLGPTTQEER